MRKPYPCLQPKKLLSYSKGSRNPLQFFELADMANVSVRKKNLTAVLGSFREEEKEMLRGDLGSPSSCAENSMSSLLVLIKIKFPVLIFS